MEPKWYAFAKAIVNFALNLLVSLWLAMRFGEDGGLNRGRKLSNADTCELIFSLCLEGALRLTPRLSR